MVSSIEKEGKGDLWSSGGVTTDQPLNFISWDDLDRVARNCGITSSGDMVRALLTTTLSASGSRELTPACVCGCVCVCVCVCVTQHVMVSFFHDVGLLIHFEEAFGGLRDLVIINPQWLASVMKVHFSGP